MSDRPAASATPSRRQAARLAAVQALYQWQEGEHGPAEIIEQFLNVRTGEAGEGGMRRDADRPLFKDVVEGTVAHKDELEQTVSAALAEDWTWERIDRLVRAILLAGAYELAASPGCAAPRGDQRVCRDRPRLLRPGRAELHQFRARPRGAPGAVRRARAVADRWRAAGASVNSS